MRQVGVAIARRAARELQVGAGIESTSVAALLRELRLGVEPLPARSVLVADEAGMVPTRELSELLDHVERAGGKLVLVGDHRQLPELEAGGAFRGLVQRGLAAELGENLRQAHAWERNALDQLRDGRADEALAAYRVHGRVAVEPTEDDAREKLVRDWLGAEDPDRAVMIAHRRVDVAALNARARAHLTAAGEVHGTTLSLPGGEFAVGDWVAIKRNDLRRGAHNGDRGRVVGVDAIAGSLTVRCGNRRVVLDRSFLEGPTGESDPTLLHGYAITGHVAQGLTVDQSFVLATDGITREWAYVALSRGRQSNRLYVAASVDRDRAEFAPIERDVADPIDRLAARLRASGAQVLAIDSGRPEPHSLDAARSDARREVDLAVRERETLEASRLGWMPGVRGRLGRARAREAEARGRLGQDERRAAERRHGSRPFVTADEQDARMAELSARIAERVEQRELRRHRTLGREP